MSNANAGARAAVCAALIVAGAAPASALELNDLTITFDTVIQNEYAGRRHDPFKSWARFQAVAGNLVWLASTTGCLSKGMSMIYKPGTFAGSVECATERDGTATNYRERAGRGTFETTMAVTGNIVTLRGTMTINALSAHMYCGKLSRKEINGVITQSMKLRIVGTTCQVLQYSVTDSGSERYVEGDHDRTPSSSVQTVNVPKGAKCTVVRRSQQPIAPPGPAPASAVGNCG